MTINESKGIKGWIAFILSGAVLGFLSGLLLINKINEDYVFESLAGASLVGGVLGLLFGFLFTRNSTMEESYVDVYRSRDLDSFYRTTKNSATELNFVDSIPNFNERELVSSLTMRYYDLSDNTTDAIIKEIRSRKIERLSIESIYNSTKYYSDISINRCPGCNSNTYVIWKNDEMKNCLICGYNIEFDNPKSGMNRFRWRLGMHSGSKLKLEDMLKLIYNSED